MSGIGSELDQSSMHARQVDGLPVTGVDGARERPSELELHRLRWQCRRGLLELDLAFEQFLARHAASLDQEQLAILNRLLEMGDNELWDLVSGRAACDIADAGPLLARLREPWS